GVVVPVPEPTFMFFAVLFAATPKPKPRMFNLYPLVRISGWLIVIGAHITRLTVIASRGVYINVVCQGAGCLRRHVVATASVTHIRIFERDLRAGTRLTITISKRGFITKVTKFLIRRGCASLRTDGCLVFGTRRLSICPGRV